MRALRRRGWRPCGGLGAPSASSYRHFVSATSPELSPFSLQHANYYCTSQLLLCTGAAAVVSFRSVADQPAGHCPPPPPTPRCYPTVCQCANPASLPTLTLQPCNPATLPMINACELLHSMQHEWTRGAGIYVVRTSGSEAYS